jgi:hypothetical protein
MAKAIAYKRKNIGSSFRLPSPTRVGKNSISPLIIKKIVEKPVTIHTFGNLEIVNPESK